MKYLSKLELPHVFIPLAVFFIMLLVAFRGQSTLQFGVLLCAAVVYLWAAVVHHHYDKSLTFESLIEYILIAVLIIMIVGGILL